VKLETGAMSMLGKTALCLVSLTYQNYLHFNLLILGLCVCVVVICAIIQTVLVVRWLSCLFVCSSL
jgi:hypothetical protein